jgi:hypothetical protein
MKPLYEHREVFRDEDGGQLDVGYDNRGEPYRTGLSLWLSLPHRRAGCFLDAEEARRLADLINTIFPKPEPRATRR